MSDRKIVLKDLPERKVLYLLCKGPWRQLPDMLRSLYEHKSGSGVRTTGPPSAFYYNSPPEVDVHDLSWEVCYPVDSSVPDYADDRLKSGVREIPATRWASIIHHGSYRKASQSYERLETWIQARSLRVSGPAEEVYLTDVSEANEEQRIEIRLPVSTA